MGEGRGGGDQNGEIKTFTPHPVLPPQGGKGPVNFLTAGTHFFGATKSVG